MDPFTPKGLWSYGQSIFDTWNRKVIRLDEYRVRKSGHLNSNEVDALRLIAANTTIPVPKVYQTRWNPVPDEGSEYIMEYMPGQQLYQVWKTLNHEQKLSICHQLSGYLAQLKQLTGKRIESVNSGPIRVGIKFPRVGGPFDTEKDFNDFLVAQVLKRRPCLPPDTKYYFRAGLTDNHKIVFAHGDFRPRNILVDQDNCVSAILDWEMAGWYPEYWDINRMFCEPTNRNMLDYRDYSAHIQPHKYVSEILAMQYWMFWNGE